MGSLTPIALILAISLTPVAHGQQRLAVGPTQTRLLAPEQAGECGTVLFNTNGCDAGYAWQLDGTAPPYFGAFAESFAGVVEVCSVLLDLSQIGNQSDQTMDVYVWDDSDGQPGAVLCIEPNVDPGPIAFWPSLSRHAIELSEACCTSDEWWCGHWGNWPGELAGWVLGADITGSGNGTPLTNIAPDLGLPTGWQHVSLAWGPTQALCIGAEVRPCEPTPVQTSTWGAIKALF